VGWLLIRPWPGSDWWWGRLSDHLAGLVQLRWERGATASRGSGGSSGQMVEDFGWPALAVTPGCAGTSAAPR